MSNQKINAILYFIDCIKKIRKRELAMLFAARVCCCDKRITNIPEKNDLRKPCSVCGRVKKR